MTALDRDAWAAVAVMGGLLAAALAAEGLGQPYWLTLLAKVAILGLAGVGLNVALGLGDMVSLGHAAFFGIGGYAMGVLASHAQSFDPILEAPILIEGTKAMPVIWLVAVIAGALSAFLIGALSLRTEGVYFIMVTLAFGQMLYFFAISWPAYGGEDGLPIYVRNGFPGLNTLDPLQFVLLVWAVLAVVLFAVHRLAHAPFGLALTATRQAPVRVRTVGLSPGRIRLAAFVISGTITALAGALFADLNRFVSPTMFSWQTSGEIIVFVILGGVGRLAGPVVGAAVFILLEHWLGGVSDHWLGFVGLLLLLIVLFARGGILGALVPKGVAHG